MQEKRAALDVIDEKKSMLFSLSDQLWENPEVKYKEFSAAVFVGMEKK